MDYPLSSDPELGMSIDKCLVGTGVEVTFQFLKIACNCEVAIPERPTMFEVYQLLRAIGERYNFTFEDRSDAFDASDANYLEAYCCSLK
ncbi:hypothetical protein SLA2020_389490 [Shorea laevis]